MSTETSSDVMSEFGVVNEVLMCGFCGAPFTGIGSGPQSAHNHAVLLVATHLKTCKLAPEGIGCGVTATISTGSVSVRESPAA